MQKSNMQPIEKFWHWYYRIFFISKKRLKIYINSLWKEKKVGIKCERKRLMSIMNHPQFTFKLLMSLLLTYWSNQKFWIVSINQNILKYVWSISSKGLVFQKPLSWVYFLQKAHFWNPLREPWSNSIHPLK